VSQEKGPGTRDRLAPRGGARAQRGLTDEQIARVVEIEERRRAGVQGSIETNRSLGEHFDRGTLRRGLPQARLPAAAAAAGQSA